MSIHEWFAGRLPDGWGTPEMTVDRDEITVVVGLEAPEGEGEAGRISLWREETRDLRVQVAQEAEHRFGRKVSWGATAGDTRALFTHLAVPAMTRLKQPERLVLDTLVDAGVARSRAEALAWCVKLVGKNSEAWLTDLRQAVQAVEQVRQAGPAA